MAKKLNRSSHRERDYNRPQEEWLCGHAKNGKACPLGPTAKGSCRGTGECMPILKGDRWHCTRADSFGGECEVGPSPDGKCGCSLPPCQPQRSLRSKRKWVGIATVLFTLGLLLVVLSRDEEGSAIDAGRLANAHAGKNMECSSCHTKTSLMDLKGVFDGDFITERALENSRLCLECHGDEIGQWDESARFTHGWTSKQVLAKIAQAKQELENKESGSDSSVPFALSLAPKARLKKNGVEGKLACMTCHQEHHGETYDLKALTDNQCQVCHQKQFKSFEHGHPSFVAMDYPTSRRTRIFFDHQSHYKKHFEEKSKVELKGFDAQHPFATGESCYQCHEADGKGEYMRLRGYEDSCAACHEDAVKGGDSLTLLAIPEIKQNLVEGAWPKSSYGLIPTMRLLMGEKQNKEVVQHGGQDEYGSVLLADDKLRDLSVEVADDLQTLFYQSWNEGANVLGARMDKNGYRGHENNSVLFEGLSLDTAREFLFPAGKWQLGEFSLPEIDDKALNRYLSGKNRSIGVWPQGSAGALTPVLQYLLSYRPGLEEPLKLLRKKFGSDGVIKLADLADASEAEMQAVERVSWEIKMIFVELKNKGIPYLEQFQSLRGGILNTSSPKAILRKVFVTAFSDKAFMQAVDAEVLNYRGGKYPAAVKIESKLKQPAKAASQSADDDFGDDDDFGAGDDGGDKKEMKKVTADDDFGAEHFADTKETVKQADKAAAGDDDFGDTPAMPKKQQGEVGAKKARTLFEPDPSDWQKSGGWFYEKYAIHYKSTGHADPVIRAWIEAAVFSANLKDEAAQKNARRVLDYTLQWKKGVKSEASGKCLKCHTIDRDVDSGDLSINWLGTYGNKELTEQATGLTHFSHSKHFVALDCVQCHVPEKEDHYAEYFPTGVGAGDSLVSPLAFSSNFRQMSKSENCSSCHNEKRVSSHCLQCHSYHEQSGKHRLPLK